MRRLVLPVPRTAVCSSDLIAQRDLVLDALGDDRQAEVVRQVDRRAHDHRVARDGSEVHDEGLIDLDLVNGQILQPGGDRDPQRPSGCAAVTHVWERGFPTG